ncbi:hypothetical protein SKAU_G00170200 [Synaphobranchus kaupii]|uniref:Uncharacterized protein n=1 Tax=Synaphobranchus kaupii TaxID=118154 RepID=A0A9Q1J0M6_SYNKA|nr:hypothetical protein SKAU_G00170200 [Synaphobranchus kaupii]
MSRVWEWCGCDVISMCANSNKPRSFPNPIPTSLSDLQRFFPQCVLGGQRCRDQRVEDTQITFSTFHTKR